MKLLSLSVMTIISMLTTAGAMAQMLPCTSLDSLSPDQLLSSVEPAVRTPGLDHGTDCYSDNVSGNPDCDWKTTVKLDQMIAPNRRLVIATATHLTGSGAWDHVVVFACKAKAIQITLTEKFLYGVRVETLSEQRLALQAAHWEPNDPVCCPSTTSYLTYNWDQEAQLFKRTERHEIRKKDSQ